MQTEILIGIGVIFSGLGFLLYLTLRGRWIINQITSQKHDKTTRVILRKLQNGR
ncbi:hypothetical protein JW835_03750 [bacterium]|nr:hypothetical protein [bacterium]